MYTYGMFVGRLHNKSSIYMLYNIYYMMYTYDEMFVGQLHNKSVAYKCCIIYIYFFFFYLNINIFIQDTNCRLDNWLVSCVAKPFKL